MSHETDLAGASPPPDRPNGKVRGSYALMFDPLFGSLFWGKLLSSSGVWIHNIVAAIVAFQLTGSALVVGVVSVVQFAPQILFAPLSGKMADRGNLPRQIALGRLITASGSVILALWIWWAGGTDGLPNALPVIGASLVVGIGFVIGGPAMQSIIPTLIRPGEMAAAMALNSVPMTVARAAGPALGALAATQLGPAQAFAIAGTCNLIFGILVLALPLPHGHGQPEGKDLSVRASLRHVRTDPAMIALLAGIAAVGYAADPALTLAPSIASDLGQDQHVVGWIASAFGIGTGIGFLVFAPLNRWFGLTRLSSSGLLLMVVGLLGLTVSTTVPLTLVCFGVSGAGMTLAFTSITTQIQNRSPDDLRGRIMALWFVGFLGSRPLAAGLNGFLADAATIDTALLVTAAAVTAVAWLCRPNRLSDPVRPGTRTGA